MRFRTILCLATFFLSCFTAAVFARPALPGEAGHSISGAPENQSGSGKITSVGDAAFEISITKDNQRLQSAEFLVDDKTKVEGKLTVGAQAVVEYRSDNGKNIAVHVVVTPATALVLSETSRFLKK